MMFQYFCFLLILVSLPNLDARRRSGRCCSDTSIKSCSENPVICEQICAKSRSPLNTVATFIKRPPECDLNGVCHCYVEQAPNTNDKIRPPSTKEELNRCQCRLSMDTYETPSVYHDGKSPESKYCVCFSALRDGKRKTKAAATTDTSSQRST